MSERIEIECDKVRQSSLNGRSSVNIGIKRTTRMTFNEILVQDFGDDYHLEHNPDLELLQKAKGLMTQYYKIDLYEQALEIYDEYLDSLYSKYGSKSHFKSMKKAGLVKEFIPAKPILKRTKAVKAFIEHGMINVDVYTNMTATQKKKMVDRCNQQGNDAIYGLLTEYNEDPYEVTINDVCEYDIENYNECTSASSLRRALFIENNKDDNNTRINSNMDLIENYFYRHSSNQDSNKTKLSSELRTPTLTELFSDNYDPDEWDITEAEYRNSKEEMVVMNGRVYNRKDLERHEIYKAIEENMGMDYQEHIKSLPTYKKWLKKNAASSDLSRFIGKGKKESKADKAKRKKNHEEAKSEAEHAIVSIMNDQFGQRFDSYEDYIGSVLDEGNKSPWFNKL